MMVEERDESTEREIYLCGLWLQEVHMVDHHSRPGSILMAYTNSPARS